MANEDNYIELVKRAQNGDKNCLNRLTEVARERLRAYVYRLTLSDELTQDILQETMLEMFKFLDKLERADRFWPWLRKIAANKIYSHYGQQQRQKTVSVSEMEHLGNQKDHQAGLASLVSQELKQTVLTAMARLRPQHRNILVLRCYEEMQYSKIAEEIGCTEFSARRLFHRAKKALVKQLARQGLSKSWLLPALVVFGKVTAPSEAAAATISVTAATVKVGAAASVAGVATSKAALVSLATAGVLAVGSAVVTSEPGRQAAISSEKSTNIPRAMSKTNQKDKGIEECWRYYPSNGNGAVLTKLIKADSWGKSSYCQYFQDEEANYHLGNRRDAIYINNYRMWRNDLLVQRLPTDGADLREFLNRVEGRSEPMEYVRSEQGGLLVIARKGGEKSDRYSPIVHRQDVLDEEYFRYNNWPKGAKMIDNRDTMHRRGWTYFRITGRIGGKEVSGTGRMPLVYVTSGQYSPWMRLQISDDLEIVDSGTEARVLDNRGKIVARYEGGSFFAGLARPWMGLHTLDMVRRDAAEKEVWFETNQISSGDKMEVVLTCNQIKLVYTINMEKDVVEKIVFSAGNGSGGELNFSYLQDISRTGDEFARPRRKYYQRHQLTKPGILWLVWLAEGALGE